MSLSHRLPFLVPLVFACSASAGELTVEPRPFSLERSFQAAVLPAEDPVLIRIEPESWADFEIVEIADHAAKVAKGATLVRFDSEAIDRKLEDSRRSLESGNLSLAQAMQDLKHLEQTVPHRLEALKRAAETAKEEHAYFVKTRRKSTEESAAQQLERRKQMLSNQQEELRQLQKMYEADDLTEDTEEIILVRQKDDVAAAEFALRMEQLDYQRTLEVTLPREAISLANAERDAAIALAKAEQDLPRSIALKKLEIESLKTSADREKQALAELEKDRGLFEIKAPADGWFYHGAIENGRWSTGDAVKALVPHGRPAANRAFATFVPAAAPSVLSSFVDEATARSLQPGVTGIAVCAGREDLEIPVKLTQIATLPGPDGTYATTLSATWPKDKPPVTGSSAAIRLIAYENPSALAVPTRALTFSSKGWMLDVKLADGKTERRPVKRGRISGENTEILSGIEAGQVIITPDK